MFGISQYVILGAVLFALGLVGFLSRRNLVVIFLSTEVMFQGVVLNAAAFARLHRQIDGQAFALFLLVIAAVEAGLALGYDGGLTIAFQVTDLSKSIDWYQNVLGFKLQYHLQEMGWCELQSGSCSSGP